MVSPIGYVVRIGCIWNGSKDNIYQGNFRASTSKYKAGKRWSLSHTHQYRELHNLQESDIPTCRSAPKTHVGQLRSGEEACVDP